MEDLFLKVAKDPLRQAQRREKLVIWKEKELPNLKDLLFKKQIHSTSTLSSKDTLSTTLTNHESTSTNQETLSTSNLGLDSSTGLPLSSSSPKSPSTSLPHPSSPSPLEELDSLEQFMVNVTTEVEKIHAEDQEKLLQLAKLHASKRASSSSSSSSSQLNTSTSLTEESDNPLTVTNNDTHANDKLKVEENEDEDEQKKVAKEGQDEKEDEDEEEEEEEEEEEDEEEDILAYAAKKLAKKKDIQTIDHSAMNYPSFRKDFYIEPPELALLTHDQVKLLRQQLDGIRVVGKDCPKPALKWTHCGLPVACLEVIKKLGFSTPTPIQAQAIPAIMSGRDVIGVAKTGSGKTLAFLLPLFRHLKDQPGLMPGEGPIALIMTPTRELAMQIHKEAKSFCKPLGLRSVCCYGGSPISDQIADLKRGAEIMVCTPGRLIDLLCANAGRVTNLRRVTYLVLDEADRMFDMGFEPQVMKIVNNVQPKRQTVLFSATFPKPMEALARKILHHRPLELSVGQKAVVAMEVNQVVEVREEHTKFLRLLEILGQAFSAPEEPRVLVFVDRQEAADHLMSHLMKRSYVCNSLHGGKDQMDRDITLADFKAGHVPILIATSVAARGLDVKGLNVVINFDCPNHKEDYIHRVGRTGRAGQKGTAYTFITKEQERYAPDIMEALRASKADIPEQLKTLAHGFKEKVKAGQAQSASKGFGGKGLEKLDKERESLKKVQKLTHGVLDEEDEEEPQDLESKDLVEGGGGLSLLPKDPTHETSQPLPKQETSLSQVNSTAPPSLLRFMPPAGPLHSSGLMNMDPLTSSSSSLGTKKEGVESLSSTSSSSVLPGGGAFMDSNTMMSSSLFTHPSITTTTSPTLPIPSTTTSTTTSATSGIVDTSGLPKPNLSTGAARAQDIIQQLNLQMKSQNATLTSLASTSGGHLHSTTVSSMAPPHPHPSSFTTMNTMNMNMSMNMNMNMNMTMTMNPHPLHPNPNLLHHPTNPSSTTLTSNTVVEPAKIFNYTCEFEINDYPQRARWKVTNKDQINQICDVSGAAITTRGSFFPSGKVPKEGERKLYLFVEGETQLAVDKAKHEINRILKEATLATVEMELKAGLASGRYSVV
ncbi:pre-mRNA processing RNA-helicase [Coelomomyces lativittatus]|nr:pre-mRNA processing RNA-helicase [Coelomomyces lativittatus]